MPKLYANVVTLAVALGSFTYGFTFGAPSVCLALEGFLTYFDVTGVGSNASYAASMQGAIVGVFFAGGFFGAFGGAWLADRIGRRRALDVVLVISVIATIISTASVHISMLLIGRILQGVGSVGVDHTMPRLTVQVAVASTSLYPCSNPRSPSPSTVDGQAVRMSVRALLISETLASTAACSSRASRRSTGSPSAPTL